VDRREQPAVLGPESTLGDGHAASWLSGRRKRFNAARPSSRELILDCRALNNQEYADLIS
jgi:hypothetical protein